MRLLASQASPSVTKGSSIVVVVVAQLSLMSPATPVDCGTYGGLAYSFGPYELMGYEERLVIGDTYMKCLHLAGHYVGEKESEV